MGGVPFYWSGANNYFLVQTYPAADGVIDEIVPDARKLELDVLRTWAFGVGEPGKLQPKPRQYNEREFKRLDRVIWAAGQEGIRLILPLVNGYGKWYGVDGGMDQYVEWSPTATEHNDFYTDDYCRDLYKDFVNYVLTRTNTHTGIEYRDDPTILLWEVANEPHLRDHDRPERRWTEADHGKLRTWIDDMAHYVKSIDRNHLVSTGSEGLYADETFDTTGSRGDFLGDHRSSAIDAASFHYYDGYHATPEEWINVHVTDAHEKLEKPAYLGEFGTTDLDGRPDFFRTVYEALRKSGANGGAFWQLIGHDGRTGDLRKPESGNEKALAKVIYYPESRELIPPIKQFSESMEAKSTPP